MAATSIARSAATHLSPPLPSKPSPSDHFPRTTLKFCPKRRRCAVVLASLHGDGNGKSHHQVGGALDLEDLPFDDASKDVHTLPRPLSSTFASNSVAEGSRLRVAYQGVQGAYSESAAQKAYPNCEAVPCEQFDTVFEAVERWLVDRAVLPFENSLGGSIHRNYDLILRHSLHIVGEVKLAVRHCLLANHGVEIQELKRVLSHPQALAQCEHTLTRFGLVREAVDDTAGAAKHVAFHKLKDSGAVASSAAAGIYGLKILAEDIQDDSDNVTRFLVLAREPIIPGTDRPFKPRPYCEAATSSYNNVPRLDCSCVCPLGFEGNPYLLQPCQDIDECKGSNQCVTQGETCENFVGGYKCYSNVTGATCEYFADRYGVAIATSCHINSSPFARADNIRTILLGLGAGVGLLLLLIGTWLVYKVVKKRKKIQRKQIYFKRNGGLLLEQQLSSGEVNVEKIKLFKSKELEKSTDSYNNDRILGQGAQGIVYKGMLADGRIVAVKKSKIVDEGKLTEFINEVVILSQINHRNVVQLLGCCLETEVPILVYEFIPNGTLSGYIHGQNEEFPLTWKMRLRIATEIAGALSYLHCAALFPIYHRDIKSSNILLDEKYRAKVADFGTSRSIAIDQTHLTTLVHGTFGYLDPEYFQSSQFTDKSDVYSFGVVLVELLTGRKPISAITRPQEKTRPQEEEYRSLATNFIVSMQKNILSDILDARVRKEGKGTEIRVVSNLARRCLELNGRNRPTMREVTMQLEAIQMLGENAQNDEGVEYSENDSVKRWDVVSSTTDQSASYGGPTSSLLEHQQLTTKTW